MLDEPANAPGQLDRFANLKAVTLRSMFMIANLINKHNEEEGHPADNQVLLFTTFGMVTGTPSAGQDPGPVELGLEEAWKISKEYLESIPGITPIQSGSYLVLKDAKIKPYCQLPQAITTYTVGELVLFVDSVQAVGIGKPTVRNN